MSIKSVLRKAREASLIEDAVEYAIFPDPGHFEVSASLPDSNGSANPTVRDQAGHYVAADVMNGLRLLQVACLDVVRETVKDFLWHVDPFQLFLPLEIEINGGSRGKIGTTVGGSREQGNEEKQKETAESEKEKKDEESLNQLPWIWRPDRAEEDEEDLEVSRTEVRAKEEASRQVPPHLYGRTRYGACIDDEWLVVWLLLEVSRKLPHVSIGE